MAETYGDPYFLIHRGDLHKVLLNRAVEVGTDIITRAFVAETDEATPSVTLENGKRYTGDLLIGADGTIFLCSPYPSPNVRVLTVVYRNQVASSTGCHHRSGCENYSRPQLCLPNFDPRRVYDEGF